MVCNQSIATAQPENTEDMMKENLYNKLLILFVLIIQSSFQILRLITRYRLFSIRFRRL